jgi:hypothetical protein
MLGDLYLYLDLLKKYLGEALAVVKEDRDRRPIPVWVLTTSKDEADAPVAYERHANCYTTKLVYFDRYTAVIAGFRISVAQLPRVEV